ncbi:hypothetical protein B0H12DRAFT_220661 [Mycena haematopus]|nr:hypothetical protein B0H12DRAFT_220661 [Mycena haematopus]
MGVSPSILKQHPFSSLLTMPSISDPTPIPLTTRNLHHGDRARLIRSTRKIGDVVGETPHVADLTPSPPAKRKPLRKRLAPALPALAPPPPPDVRPVLYLRVPDSPSEESVCTLTTPAPSPTLTVALNLRPATSSDDDTARRRRMAKLRHTLGANVPTELVYPPEDTNGPRYRRLTSRTLPPSQPRPDSRRQSRVSRRMSREERSAAHSETDPISRGWVWVGKRDEIPADVKARIKRSKKKESGLPFDWASIGRLRDLQEEEDQLSPIQAGQPRLHRREMGWSGEWAGSAQNMDEVVHRLRGLKAK